MSGGRDAGTGAITCPRCEAHVAEDQDWCLRCGDAARTRLVPTPNWRAPVIVTAAVAALALVVIAVSFVQLTRDEAPAAPTTATAPALAPATTAPTVATTPPAATTATTPGATATTPGIATTPGATATAPGATATAPGATATAPRATTSIPAITSTVTPSGGTTGSGTPPPTAP